MLDQYTSEPNTFFLKPLIVLAEKQAQFAMRYSMQPISSSLRPDSLSTSSPASNGSAKDPYWLISTIWKRSRVATT